MTPKQKKAYKFFNRMLDEGFEFSKSGDNWVKIDPPPEDIEQIMLLGELGDELSIILDELDCS